MKDLFIKSAELVKFANTIKVSPESSNWGKEALNRFYSDFPDLNRVTVRVTFKEKDEARGYGVGAINIGAYALPVIIREFQLYPFDVALSNDNVVPFTRETVQLFLSSNVPFSLISKENEPDTFMRFFDTPGNAGFGFAMEKSGESLPNVYDDEIIDRMVDILGTDEFKNHPNVKEITDMVTNMRNFDKIASNFYNAEIYYVHKEIDGTYTKYAGTVFNSDYDITTGIEPYDAPAKKIKAADTIKVAGFSPTYTQTQGVVYRISDDEDLFLENDGNYRVLVGRDIDVVKRANHKEGTITELIKHASLPDAGNIGFMFDPEGGKIKTSLLEMQKVAFHEDGLSRLTGEFVSGSHLVKFATLRGIKKASYSKDESTLYFPESWMFAKLEDELSMDKVASHINERIVDVEAVKCLGPDHFTFNGPVLKKYASDRDLFEASIHKVAFCLMQCGAGLDDVVEVTKLQPGDTYIVKQALVLPTKQDPTIKVANEDNAPMYDTKEVMKLAVELGSRTGVDAVLGTAFLKKDTINEFVKNIPGLEESASLLAKLLLYIRMGADGVNEISIRNAMIHLSKVIHQLYGIQNLEKV